MSKVDDIVHLHTHSDMSQLDGCGKIKDYAKTAKDRGHKAFCFTEHGTMRGYYQQMLSSKDLDLKPIYGIEFYMCSDMARKGATPDEKAAVLAGKTLNKSEQNALVREYERQEGLRAQWHLCAWAESMEGLKNLFRLSSASWIDGFYYRPRIDVQTLLKYHEGVRIGSACTSGIFNAQAHLGRKKQALEVADKLYHVYRDRMYLEIMPHDFQEQAEANKFTLELYDRFNGECKLLATQDAHYILQEDWRNHEVLLAIGTNDKMSNPERFRFTGTEFHFRTRLEMIEAFRKAHGYLTDAQVKVALDNTITFAEGCDVKIEIDRFKCLMPQLDIPQQFDGNETAYLKYLCCEGWPWRDIPGRAAKIAKRDGKSYEVVYQGYIDRLRLELGSIIRQKFVAYFLLVHDIYHWARGEGIACGPGRGSAAGSLVSFLIGVTSVDPIEHGLIFERFINADRIDLPDIDMDFEDVRRQEVFEYLRNKYGQDKVCQIATIGKLTGKQCLKDISRVLEVPYVEVNQVTNSIIERSSGDERASQTIEDSFKDFKVCREFNAKYPEVLQHAKKLEGMAKNLGIHAAGVVASPVPLTDLIPLEVRNHGTDPVLVSAVDMYGCQDAGLLKLDVLGLRTMTVLRETVEAIKERHGVDVDLERLELDDQKVLDGFTAHNYVGIFQYDSPGADKICSGVSFDTFEDVAAMTALNRPGTARSGLATQYVARKKNPALVKKVELHPKVNEITSDTLGIIVYQEHVIKIFTDIAGFAPSTADSLRKIIAKKWGDESLDKQRERFIQGAVAKTEGMTEEIAGKIMDAITFFGSYGFNKTISSKSYVLRAGAHSSQGTPWIQIKDLVAAANSRTEPVWHPTTKSWTMGRQTPIAQKINAGRLNLIRMDEDGRCRPARLKAIHDHGECEVYRVRLDNGGVTPAFTLNHRLLTDTGYKRVADLEPNDELVFMGENQSKDYCPWWLNEDTRWRQSGRVNAEYRVLVDQIWDRDQAKCARCGEAGIRARGGHEVAHINPPASCDYNKKIYHSMGNMELLCNSCHKKADYQSGERTKRWRKGHPTYTLGVIGLEPAGIEHCYDLEMEGPSHNYVAADTPDGLAVVSHNSHATAYGMIAYWGMWLKTYYPVEFYWALLKNEPNRIRVQQFAKDAKKHGIEILPPNVNASKIGFSIDNSNNAIRGSLVDIKNVGGKAAETIMENQPFATFCDMLNRIDRRKCNKRMIASLCQAGALSDLVPNTRWFLENIDDLWKIVGKASWIKNVEEMLEASKATEQWSDEEKMMAASQVSPLAFGQHPVDAYSEFISKNIKVPIVDMSHEDFFKDYNGIGCYVLGVIVETKYNQIGDFHTGAIPDEDEQLRMGWGKRYANINVEDAGGKQNRIKVDYDIFDDFREVVDSGIGTPVVLHAIANARYENMRAQFLVNLEEYRQSVIKGNPLSVWEKIIKGEHPVLTRNWSTKAKRRLAMQPYADIIKKADEMADEFGAVNFTITGVISNVKTKYDKRMQKMAFFGLVGVDGFIDVVCFGSSWLDFEEYVVPGQLVTLRLTREKGGNFLHSRDGKLWLLK